MKARPHVVPSVLDSCSPVQEALCACSEGKKGEPVSMGLLLFELESTRNTDKIPGPSVPQIPQHCT